MKATEQYFPVVLYLLCCTRWFQVLSLWMKSYIVTIKMKATEQYFPAVLFTTLHKVVPSFVSVCVTIQMETLQSYFKVARLDFLVVIPSKFTPP